MTVYDRENIEMSRSAILVYGFLCYAIGLGGLGVFILFAGGWDDRLPIRINSNSPVRPVMAVLVNTSLIALFGIQHSVMARRRFKEVWTSVIPPAIERSTYVAISGILMCILCVYWQPVDGRLWHIDQQVGRILVLVMQWLGWTLVVAASFMTNHFELFGLEQAYRHFRSQSETPPVFTERLMYRVVRHPLQLGLLIGMWSAPTMTVTQAMLSGMMTCYIFVSLHFEERDLVRDLGQDYRDYQTRVRMLLPMRRAGKRNGETVHAGT